MSTGGQQPPQPGGPVPTQDVEIAINGIPIHLDVDRYLTNWIEAYWPLSHVRYGEHLATRDTHRGSARTPLNTIGMPIVNYRPPESVRVNTLYWPTGATRWGTCWVLMRSDEFDNVTQFWRSSGNQVLCEEDPATLTLFDKQNDIQVDYEFFPLEPQPVTPGQFKFNPFPESSGALWLLPLVDRRYFWQYYTLTPNVGSTTSWSDLIDQLAAQLGTTIQAPVGFNFNRYGFADPNEFGYSENCAILLDAVATSIGCRVVMNYDGAVFLDDGATSFTRKDAGIQTLFADKGRFNTAGYYTNMQGPLDKVGGLVTFRKKVDGHVLPGPQYYTATGGGSSGTINSRNLIHAASYATFTAAEYAADPNTPNNQGDLDTYANDIYSGMFFFGFRESYNFTIDGILNWPINGFDDCIVIRLGTEERERLVMRRQDQRDLTTKPRKAYERVFSTQIRSFNLNRGAMRALGQVGEPDEIDSGAAKHIAFALNGPFPGAGATNFTVTTFFDGYSPQGSGTLLSASGYTGVNGDAGVAIRVDNAATYQIVALSGTTGP